MFTDESCDCKECFHEDAKGNLVHDNKARVADFAHDCDYVAARDAYIPRAISHANSTSPSSGESRGFQWTRAFAIEMDRLIKENTR